MTVFQEVNKSGLIITEQSILRVHYGDNLNTGLEMGNISTLSHRFQLANKVCVSTLLLWHYITIYHLSTNYMVSMLFREPVV